MAQVGIRYKCGHVHYVHISNAWSKLKQQQIQEDMQRYAVTAKCSKC